MGDVPLDQLGEGVAEDLLRRWVSAIERAGHGLGRSKKMCGVIGGTSASTMAS
jgi:hypothetical protein